MLGRVLALVLPVLVLGGRHRHSYDRAQAQSGSESAPNGRSFGAVVPLPQIIHPRHPPDILALSKDSFRLYATLKGCDILNAALAKSVRKKLRYPALIFAKTPAHPQTVPTEYQGSGPIDSLVVEVQDRACPKYPQLGMKENYTLDVYPNGTSVVVGGSVWGALRGLETFSQLVFSPSRGAYLIRTVAVADWPRFQHRGLLLDTSRHFLPLHSLFETLAGTGKTLIARIDSGVWKEGGWARRSGQECGPFEELMSQNKLNVFHWHVVDDPAFPFRSRLFPQLADKGAYSPDHTYSPADVASVVEFARLRGIRVIPEFDTPGHTKTWAAIDKLLTRCYDKAGKPTDEYANLDLTASTTWDFLFTFFSEILALFPDNSLHIGGDEVSAYTHCWLSNPETKNLMRAMNYTTWQELEGYYFKNFAKILKRIRADVQLIGWNEVFDHGDALPKDSVIQIWTGGYAAELARVTKAGYKALLSSCWYLDIIQRDVNWKSYYNCDPHGFNGTAEEKARVLGGEACLWGEFVDGTNLTPRLWPRGSVVAERLWSSADEQNLHQAGLRFDEHRCRLISRGYPAEPIIGPGFCPVEWQ